MQAVVSSAFEGSIGLGQYAHFAAAVDRTAGAHSKGSDTDAPGTTHGLGTAEWFSEDLLQKSLVPEALSADNVGILTSASLDIELQFLAAS